MSERTDVMIDPTPYSKRDAVHVAIAPMQAQGPLMPGEHVDKNGKLCKQQFSVGIVNPFLGFYDRVNKDDWFWCFIKPNTVTGMRHHWEHPDFNDDNIEDESTIDDIEKQESIQWVKDFLDQNDLPDYELIIDAIDNGESFKPGDGSGYEPGVKVYDDYIVAINMDAYGNIPDEFWWHVENILGHAPKCKPTYFSCSC